MIKLKQLFMLGLGLLSSQFITAQTTVTYTSDSTMSDAMVINGSLAGNNFGTQNQISVATQVNQQMQIAMRSFIQYDLSAIPSDAIIVSATLNLTTSSVDNSANHPFYVERVNEGAWSESTINWNNQPDVTTSDQINIAHSAVSGGGTHSFDVKKHVQKMVYDPARNYGWRIRLAQETLTSSKGVSYHSSEAGSPSIRPTLTIQYVLPITFNTTVNHCTSGNEDGELSVVLSGGSNYAASNIYFYETVHDTTQRGNATLLNVKTTYNVQYDAITKTVTADDLKPGIYIMRIIDPSYSASGNDQRFIFYRHIMVGREGEVTKGILLPDYRYQENTAIEYDKPANSSPLDRENTNYNPNSTTTTLRVSDIPNSREGATLLEYKTDFDPQLDYSQADLRIYAFSKFYRGSTASNSVELSIITDPWDEHLVTWNTRPAVDTNIQVYVPSTAAVGYDNVHTNDTISLLPFVDYWQTNPLNNYGFEIAMESYVQPKAADRSYRSAKKNVNFLELAFTVKLAVEASYDPETELGSIQVNVPSGSTGPFKYLIGYQPLPALATLWNNVKDSIPVDSATFFLATEQSSSFTFENLDAERYYIGVYDNTGSKILDGTANVTPEIELLDNTNIDFANGLIKRGNNGSTGSATINGLIAPSENGGFEFQVDEIGGNMVIGFNDMAGTTPTTTAEFEYSFEFFADNSFQVFKAGVSLFTGTVSVDDIFRIKKENKSIAFYMNEFELARAPIATSEAAYLTGVVLYRTVLGAVSHAIKFEYFKPLAYPIRVKVEHLECGDGVGKISLGYNGLGFSGGSGLYSIVDVNTSIVVASGTFDGTEAEVISLPSGDYKIIYTYTVGGVTYSTVVYETIANKIYWNILNEAFVEIEGTTNTISASGSLDNGLAISQNGLGFEQEGWMSFNVKLVRYYTPFGDPVPFSPSKARILVVNGDIETKVQVNVFQLGSGVINKYIWVTGEAGSAFTTHKDGILKITHVDVVPAPETFDGEFEISFDSPTPFATVEDITGESNQIFYAFASGTNAMVYESYASFCGFENIRSYADLTKKLDGGYYLAQNGIVKFIYNEEYNDLDAELSYSIFDATNTKVIDETDIAQTVVYGDNRYDLDFSSFTGDEVLDNGVYILEVTNEKNERWYLRFKIINN